MFLSPQGFLKLFSVIFVALFLVSCSNSKEKAAAEREEDKTEIVEQVSSVEIETREPIYVYGHHQEKILKEVILRLNAEPLLLSSSYVRLVGVVSGGRPMAVIEVGGRGLCIGVGEEVGEYMVVGISEKEVKLKRR